MLQIFHEKNPKTWLWFLSLDLGFFWFVFVFVLVGFFFVFLENVFQKMNKQPILPETCLHMMSGSVQPEYILW